MKLVLIEDNLDSVKEIKNHYTDKGWNVLTSDFDNALDVVNESNPDIIVMDWMNDFDNDKDRGRPIFDVIHDKPIIIYSGAAAVLSLEDVPNNPFINKISKGDENDAINKIDEWEKYLNLVNEIKSQINDATSLMMASLKPAIESGSYPGDDVIKFMLNKQASEFFNSKLTDETNNPTWTQYLYPPLSKKLLVADIVRSVACDNFYVILTPSCDMARAEPNKKILMASCIDCHKFHDYGQIANFDPRDEKKGVPKVDAVSKLLSYGYNTYRVPLPELPNIFPFLTVNLKDLQFVELSTIAVNCNELNKSEHIFVRIASINSPYREQIVWAHMVNSCRPGVPDRNYRSWAEAIIK